jgi:hypothetical protein
LPTEWSKSEVRLPFDYKPVAFQQHKSRPAEMASTSRTASSNVIVRPPLESPRHIASSETPLAVPHLTSRRRTLASAFSENASSFYIRQTTVMIPVEDPAMPKTPKTPRAPFEKHEHGGSSESGRRISRAGLAMTESSEAGHWRTISGISRVSTEFKENSKPSMGAESGARAPPTLSVTEETMTLTGSLVDQLYSSRFPNAVASSSTPTANHGNQESILATGVMTPSPTGHATESQSSE